jgi:hypothetical protein
MKNQDRNIRPDSFKHLQHGYNRKILIYNSRNLIVFIDIHRLAGSGVDKMAMHMTHDKLAKFVKSELFNEFSCLGEVGACGVVRSGTKHHIRVMFECLEVLLA